MSPNCKHGVDDRFCSICQKAKELDPLPDNPLQFVNNKDPVIVLRREHGSTHAKVLYLDQSITIDTIEGKNLRPFTSTPDNKNKHPQLLKQFHNIALEGGYLFHPGYRLTYREGTEDGPTHCYHCKIKLSFEKGSLGCIQCRAYVCRCGRCLCGVTAKNYRGDLFTQKTSVPVSREDRIEFIRVARYCSVNAQ